MWERVTPAALLVSKSPEHPNLIVPKTPARNLLSKLVT